MKKIKILGISKTKCRSEFIFPKKQEFFEVIRRFLFELGFGEDEDFISSIGKSFDKKTGEFIMDKEQSIKASVDITHNYSNKDYSIDIIYFKKKIVLIVNYKIDKQQIVSRVLDKFVKY